MRIKLVSVLSLVLVLSFVLWAEVPFSQAPPGGTFQVQLAVPTSPTAVCAATCWADFIVIANTGSSDRTVDVYSTTGSIKLFPTVTVTAHTAQYINIPGGLKFPGGLTWTSSGSGLHGWIKGKK